jgi:hypothetical protein
MLPTGQRFVDQGGNVVLTFCRVLIADSGVERSEGRVPHGEEKEQEGQEEQEEVSRTRGASPATGRRRPRSPGLTGHQGGHLNDARQSAAAPVHWARVIELRE